jgi:hypothetical protein
MVMSVPVMIAPSVSTSRLIDEKDSPASDPPSPSPPHPHHHHGHLDENEMHSVGSESGEPQAIGPEALNSSNTDHLLSTNQKMTHADTLRFNSPIVPVTPFKTVRTNFSDVHGRQNLSNMVIVENVGNDPLLARPHTLNVPAITPSLMKTKPTLLSLLQSPTFPSNISKLFSLKQFALHSFLCEDINGTIYTGDCDLVSLTNEPSSDDHHHIRQFKGTAINQHGVFCGTLTQELIPQHKAINKTLFSERIIGHGVFRGTNGEQFEGSFVNELGHQMSSGTLTDCNGRCQEGSFYDGVHQGKLGATGCTRRQI